MIYTPKTIPFHHQAVELAQHARTPVRGIFWEQGTGKTKPVLDTAGILFTDGEIDGLCVIAPNGVHRNWVSDEIPTHLPDRIRQKTKCHVWYSTTTKKHQQSFEEVLHHDGLAVLVMSYHAVWTDRGQKAWKQFLEKRRCLYVLDESQRIKNPGTKWARRILGSATQAKYRRVLSGTPIDNAPFDIYNQLRFLDPNIWHPLGIKTYAAFKQCFGIWETRQSPFGQFAHCVSYRNLPKLKEMMEAIGSRVTKDEVLDLPPKLYSKRYFDLTPSQRRLYDGLKNDLRATLDSGEEVTALLAIVKLLRLQQITCGYLPNGDEGELLDLPLNPRLDLLADVCSDIPHKAIIWARFRRDIDLITRHKFFRGRCVRVDGSVVGPDRGAALDVFQKGQGAQFLIANPAAIGTGVTLHAARTVIYYSNSFKLSDRLQSEDRAHRIGQEYPVTYIDIMAQDTVDEHIVSALRKKVNIASLITGDTLKEWI